MIPFQKAYEIVTEETQKMVSLFCKEESVHIDEAMGRILAENIKADRDYPPAPKSRVDGYACKKEDALTELQVVGTIPAGVLSNIKIKSGECAKIMTGAIMPEGADAVLRVEHTEELLAGKIKYICDQPPMEDFSPHGEDLKEGDIIATRGSLLTPQLIAILATVGVTKPKVYQKIKVGIIATGDEVVNPSERPNQAEIRDSNSIQLYSQLVSMGCKAKIYGVAPDSLEAIEKMYRSAASENNIVILSGGVSMGDFDFVPKVLEAHKVNIKFDRVAIKPGKPTTFGVADKHLVFALPGNPVTTYVIFEILVKPALYSLMGHNFKPKKIKMKLGDSLHRRNVEREELLPVSFADAETVMPIKYHGSAHLNAMVGAAGLVRFPIDVAEIKKNSNVEVYLL